MPIIPILFTSLILISTILYLYSTWILTRDKTFEHSAKETPLSIAKRKQQLLLFVGIRLASPLMTLTGIAWGVLWIGLTFGFWSIQLALFILGLVLVYGMLYLILTLIVFKLIQNFHP